MKAYNFSEKSHNSHSQIFGLLDGIAEVISFVDSLIKLFD